MSTVKSSSAGRHHAHHFRDASHEFEASKLGVWVFLCTEILMFGGLFVGYIIYNKMFPEAFQTGAELFLEWKYGAVNTVVLLLSSFTMVLSIYFAQKNDRSKTVMSLAITLICGFIFMFIKYLEYSHKIHVGALPGALFSYTGEGADTPFLPLYMSFYFLMTGMHGLHVLIGMGLIFWVLLRARKGEFGPNYFTPLEGVGLFWHLVDVIWIYLFPLLYLI